MCCNERRTLFVYKKEGMLLTPLQVFAFDWTNTSLRLAQHKSLTCQTNVFGKSNTYVPSVGQSDLFGQLHDTADVFSQNIKFDIHNTTHMNGVEVRMLIGIGNDSNLKCILSRIAHSQTDSINRH